MSYLELAKKAREEYRREQQAEGGAVSPTTPTPPASPPPAVNVDITEGLVLAVLIDSEVLGAPIWFALADGWTPGPGDKMPVFYASELPALRQKTPEQLRSIFNVKRTFSGGMIRQ